MRRGVLLDDLVQFLMEKDPTNAGLISKVKNVHRVV